MVPAAAARQLSGALAMRAGASQLVAHAVAIGDCRLRPATRIRLAAGDDGQPDAAPNRSGPLTITRASHRIDAAGYVTELSTEPADPAPVPAPATVTLGRVFDVDDPLGMARVRVELPALGDLVTAWMPVVCAGAGPGAGIVALPPVRASVAVLGPADQPGRGVVVGGLFGDDQVPGPPVAGGHSRRIALSVSDGPRAVLDGETSEVVFDNGDGSRLELSPRGVTFLAGADLEIAAPGRRIVIRADAIELERG
jgi:hypothetical protein